MHVFSQIWEIVIISSNNLSASFCPCSVWVFSHEYINLLHWLPGSYRLCSLSIFFFFLFLLLGRVNLQ